MFVSFHSELSSKFTAAEMLVSLQYITNWKNVEHLNRVFFILNSLKNSRYCKQRPAGDRRSSSFLFPAQL